MKETSVRLLRLLSLLQSRRDWSGAELASRLGVTTRTVRNDVERLRDLGYAIDSASGTGGGYRLGAGTVLPPLLLDDEEAVAVAVGLHTAAGGTVTGIGETSERALTKLRHMLPSRLRHRIDAVVDATLPVRGEGPTVDTATLDTIAAAIRDRERLRFDYVRHDGTTGPRSAEPHRLVFTGRRWYLLAWDDDRNDWRTFRADRIRPRTPNGPRFPPREPPEGDAAAHVVRGAGAAVWPHRARIRLHAPAGRLAERLPPAAGLLRAEDDDHCVLETGAGTLFELIAFLASLDVGFTVLGPPGLRDLVGTLGRRFSEAAGGTG